MEHTIILEWDVPEIDSLETALRQTIATVLQEEQVPHPCEINVLLCDDQGIQEINDDMRDNNTVTDVLSFPMFQLEAGTAPSGEAYLDVATGLLPLGDIALNLTRAKEQGEEYGHGFHQEVVYLTLHSVLHLLGYDHLDEGIEKAKMRQREKDILPLL